MTKPNLDAAYALQTPEDNRKLYADWAESYDTGFAQDMAYDLPRHVATALNEVYDGRGPILDVGAGTGLLAAYISDAADRDIDALDISNEMLAIAAGKGVYRKTIEADLTRALDIPDTTYRAVVSSGTFTHGHIGPDALDELLRIAGSGAIFVLSINAEHFEARGFTAKFAALAPMITEMSHKMVPIYGAGQAAAHQDDQAFINVFRKR
jgi:predicted TPR repeat methyltransferase